MSQPSLFERDDVPRSEHSARVDATHAEAASIAAALPEALHFGTSSWSFPGWAGIVYRDARSTTALAREGLREYAQHPLLTTVVIDRSYYAPIPLADLTMYASQLPPGFRCCTKVPASVTAYASGPGSRAERNPGFLSIDRMHAELLEPFAAGFRNHTGPFILEFPPFPLGMALEPAAFVDRLGAFLSRLPKEFTYAVELRDRRLLTREYRATLAEHGVAHTFNYWSAMPMLAAQAAIVPPEDLPFTVVRLLLRPGTWYEDQREAFRPFNRIVEPDERMRTEVGTVVRRALARGRRVFVLVNNKAEGSSPLTVLELARRFLTSVPHMGSSREF